MQHSLTPPCLGGFQTKISLSQRRISPHQHPSEEKVGGPHLLEYLRCSGPLRYLLIDLGPNQGESDCYAYSSTLDATMWKRREERIINSLLLFRSTIICLQEVSYDSVTSSPAFQRLAQVDECPAPPPLILTGGLSLCRLRTIVWFRRSSLVSHSDSLSCWLCDLRPAREG
jgi:hypothetical protein